MIVHLTAEAEYDLETISDYIARDNPARALSFLQELRSKCLGLGKRGLTAALHGAHSPG